MLILSIEKQRIHANIIYKIYYQAFIDTEKGGNICILQINLSTLGTMIETNVDLTKVELYTQPFDVI